MISKKHFCNCHFCRKLLNCIRKTCPCNVYPLIPHFYIAKLGYGEVYLFFFIFAPKHRLWVLVRTASPRRFAIYVLKKNKRNIKSFLMKIFNFYNLRKICILHGHVFVMVTLISLVLMCLYKKYDQICADYM